jgi:hypothetical protein
MTSAPPTKKKVFTLLSWLFQNMQTRAERRRRRERRWRISEVVAGELP